MHSQPSNIHPPYSDTLKIINNSAFALAEALRPRLTVAQRRRVREAQEKTVQAMVQEELPDAAARQLGLMDGRQLKRTAERVLGCVRP